MEVSIVIVNYNGKDMTAHLIESIKKSSFKSFEILVIDNASTDSSCEYLQKKFPKINVVKNKENLGYSGINNAIKHCKGKYILFLNNDMEIDMDCIGKLVRMIKSDERIAIAAPKLFNYYDKSLKSGGTWISRAFYNGHIKDENCQNAKEIPYLGVGLIRKDFVEKFGYLFDPDYFIYAEDVDLGLRVRLCGMKVMLCPNAFLYHMHSVTTQKILKTNSTYLMERNLLITFFKILSWKNIILFLPYVKFMRLVAILKDIFLLKFSIAFARIKALFFILFHLQFLIKKRKETQKFRRANDSYILKVFTEKYIFKKKFIV